MTLPEALKNPDPADAYQELFDALGRAYWDASDIDSKDMIHGAQESVGKILTAIDKQDLADNTAIFLHLAPQIQATNAALKKIQRDIDKITKNINTSISVISAISKVLSLFP